MVRKGVATRTTIERGQRGAVALRRDVRRLRKGGGSNRGSCWCFGVPTIEFQ
ncbi:MAG: hypothetical protein AVDCRST_MAG59-1689 [uncultured Thermomicrobiales bacterium]|uniref:Uncharacterized protein n=1 Tax=uncultured Thermomicrobiales bacterium TaxID=1645740 RepID=A0A6J4UKU5_9BACT|nr:MAG: hypothetical protein AVDCRST_MAG59-1689 [uncultured Thermomicrobiales bacterium]